MHNIFLFLSVFETPFENIKLKDFGKVNSEFELEPVIFQCFKQTPWNTFVFYTSYC